MPETGTPEVLHEEPIPSTISGNIISSIHEAGISDLNQSQTQIQEHQINQSFVNDTTGVSITTIPTTSNRADQNSSLDRTTSSTMTGPLRVPGTYAPDWLSDNETTSCMSCASPFTLIKRRHHCRSCGKIFCGDCCYQKASLLYMDNKEARVCGDCFRLIELTLINRDSSMNVPQSTDGNRSESPASSSHITSGNSSKIKVQGVLKTVNQNRSNNSECNNSLSSSSEQPSIKQVTFSDGIRPGTDLTEPFPYPVPSSSTSSNPSSSFNLLTRQTKDSTDGSSSSGKRSKCSRSINSSSRESITVCDELGYLPPIVMSKGSSKSNNVGESTSSSSNLFANLVGNRIKLMNIHSSMESRSCPLNGVVKFDDLRNLVGKDNPVTFQLLKDFYLKVKVIKKSCCMDKCYSISDDSPTKANQGSESSLNDFKTTDKEDEGIHYAGNSAHNVEDNITRDYWYFASDGLSRFGQNEVIFIIDKDIDDQCIPRDVFKIYLTLHELSLRRQPIENLGNLIFQDGLFGHRDTAGLLFVHPLSSHCLENLALPSKPFLIALALQRWEVPWSKIFPVRLLLRLGHKYGAYPYPIVSFRTRDPVYYEVGHTIISILGDFRNFSYSITHVDGLKVMLNKKTRTVLVRLNQSSYQQFNKVLDSSNKEHVLAWSCCPFPEADGHLVSVQNEDGQYETVEFFNKSTDQDISFESLDTGLIIGASFIIFSGALKVNQSGQSAKISIVEDGLLIQIQSSTMAALKNAIHFMHQFDIDCGK